MEQQDVNLLPRDKLLRDTFTPAETLLFGIILLTANIAFWFAEPRSYWLLGFFLIAAGMTPVILKTHEHTHPFFVTFLWPKFWFYTIPVWLLLLQFCLGLIQTPLSPLELEGKEFIALNKPESNWLPVSTSATSTWPTVFGFSAIYLVAIGLFIVPKSRAFLDKLISLLCLSSVLVGLFGFIQYGLNASEPLLTKGTGTDDFFAFFPYSGHWAAFACIWTCVNIGMALLQTRFDDRPPFVQSTGPWYLAGGTILGATAFLVQARWPAAILMLTYSSMLMLVSIHFISDTKDPHRKQITVFSGIASLGMLAAGIFRIFNTENDLPVEGLLKNASVEMFRDNPLFGWGLDSFASLLPYYGNDLLLANNYERAGSDVLQFLAELGVLGIIPMTALVSMLIIRYLKGRHNIQLTNHLLLGCTPVVVLAFFDSPFMSPAVWFSFLIVLFTALRWADVSRNRTDEVDAHRLRLVTPHSKRRVPFFTGDKD